MRGIKKLSVNIISIMLLFSFLLTGCAHREIVITTGFYPGELMRINDKNCQKSEFMLYLTTIQNQYEAVYGEALWSQAENGVSLEEKVKDMVLAKIAQVKVMNLMAESYGLSLDVTESEKVKEASVTFFESLNDTEKELIGVTLEDVVSIYSEYALANKVYEYVIRDVNPEISDDEARSVTVQKILVKTGEVNENGEVMEYSLRSREEAKVRAEAALREVNLEEESFESISAKYNEDDSTSMTFKRGEMEPEIEEAAFSLDKDEVSGLVETSRGFYIFKCISDFDVYSTQQNKVDILKTRKQEVFSETYDAFLKELSKTLNEKLYSEIIMIHNPEVTTSSFFDVEF